MSESNKLAILQNMWTVLLGLPLRSCPHIMSANFGGFQTPPPPLVSNRQHLLDPPSLPRQPSSAFGWPPLYQRIQGKHTFWYEIVMVFWLLRTEKQLLSKVGLICLFYTHLCHFLTHFNKFFSGSTPSSAIISIWLTPSSPSGGWRNMWTAPYLPRLNDFLHFWHCNPSHWILISG